MKTNPFTTLTAGLAVLLIVPACAIEAPADDAPPPPDVATLPVPPARPGVKADNAPAAPPVAKAAPAFLGVVSAPVPELLAAHLGLKPGEGIVVQALMPEGPAAKAGVAVHDIITRVGDQPVASSADLTREVAAHPPGTVLELAVIHQGKPAAIKVTLGTRPDGMAANDPHPLDQLNLEGLPQGLADRVRALIEGNLGGLELQFDEEGMEVPPRPEMKEAMRAMKQRMEQALQGLNVPPVQGIPKLEIQQGATIRLMDEQGSIELKSNDDSKEVTLRDKENKITWNGPWDTEQDRAAAPEEVRKRVDRLHLDAKFQGNGLRLHGGIHLPAAPPTDVPPE